MSRTPTGAQLAERLRFIAEDLSDDEAVFDKPTIEAWIADLRLAATHLDGCRGRVVARPEVPRR